MIWSDRLQAFITVLLRKSTVELFAALCLIAIGLQSGVELLSAVRNTYQLKIEDLLQWMLCF